MNSPPPTVPPGKCPVCTSRFRGVTTCPRCGTDLSALMRISARAWAARRQRRAALHQGDLAEAFRLTQAAHKLQKAGFSS